MNNIIPSTAGTAVGSRRADAVPVVGLTDEEASIGKAFSDCELLQHFRGGGSFSKHLLTIYGLAIGVNARFLVDIGIGATTRALLAAATVTRGRVYSCDFDRKRYADLLKLYPVSKQWRLSLTDSGSFIRQLPDGLDFVSHDGAHDPITVREDIAKLIPKVKQFGIITVHDTQHPQFGPGLAQTLDGLSQRFPVTSITLPFSCGLTIMRIERSKWGSISPAGMLKKGRKVTAPFPMRTYASLV